MAVGAGSLAPQNRAPEQTPCPPRPVLVLWVDPQAHLNSPDRRLRPSIAAVNRMLALYLLRGDCALEGAWARGAA